MINFVFLVPSEPEAKYTAHTASTRGRTDQPAEGTLLERELQAHVPYRGRRDRAKTRWEGRRLGAPGWTWPPSPAIGGEQETGSWPE